MLGVITEVNLCCGVMEYTGMNRDPRLSLMERMPHSLATLLRNKWLFRWYSYDGGYGTHALLTAGRPRQAHAGSMVAALRLIRLHPSCSMT